MTAVLISGGTIDETFAMEFLKTYQAEYIVAVDRGLLFCHQAGIRPNAIVGDFDSIPQEILEQYEGASDLLVKRLIPEKDDSDTECAMHLVMEQGADEIYLLGGTGTRLDHMIANIQLLAYTCIRGIKMYMADPHNLITVLNQPTVLRKEDQYGKYVSFFALGDEVPDITLSGFKYPLTDYRLTNVSCGLSLSNEIMEEEAEVRFSSGILVMIQSRD